MKKYTREKTRGQFFLAFFFKQLDKSQALYFVELISNNFESKSNYFWTIILLLSTKLI